MGALIALSASFGLSWTRPVGPGGRSEGPASLAHGIAFSRFLVYNAFFPRLRFSSLQGGGQRGVLELFWNICGTHLRLKMDPWRDPFRPQAPRIPTFMQFSFICLPFKLFVRKLFDGLNLFLKSLFPGLAECAERLNPRPPACRGHGVWDSAIKFLSKFAKSQISKFLNSLL